MSRIITISREFASGGRELGKRLADALNVACYDQKIIDMVAESENMSREYVAEMSEKYLRNFYPATIGNSFAMTSSFVDGATHIAVAEQKIIKQLADEGSCVIVGRAADNVLRDKSPFRIFVCADDKSKVERCRQRAKEGEDLSEKEILRKCKKIDKQRRTYNEMYSSTSWGKASEYDLCINTSGKEIKALVAPLADYINLWFENSEK